jgi:hypothetical protein
MIVWLSSYPRSGNTFLRIVLHRLYGVPTYSIYEDDDPVAQRVGPELVGYRRKPGRAQMQESPELYFTKTHKRRKADSFPAIYLARDGRDAVVSQAHLRSAEQREANETSRPFDVALRHEIERPYLPGQPSSGTWGGNVLSWLDAHGAPLAVLKYEDLVADPRGSVARAVGSLVPALAPRGDADLPSFEDLHAVDPAFFRRGAIGSHRDEMSPELEDIFWAQPENAAAMQALGYTR